MARYHVFRSTTGLPILMDKLMMEAWFGFNDFVIFCNNDGDWAEIEKHLQSIDETMNGCGSKRLISESMMALWHLNVSLNISFGRLCD